MKNIIFISIFLLLASCASSPSRYNEIRVNRLNFSSDVVGLINIMSDLPASSKIAILNVPEESKKIMENLLENTGFKVVKSDAGNILITGNTSPAEGGHTLAAVEAILGKSKSNVVKNSSSQVSNFSDPISFGKAVGADVVIFGKKELEGTLGSRFTLRVVKVETGELISLSRTYESNKFVFWIRRTMVYFNRPMNSKIAVVPGYVPEENRGIIDATLEAYGFNVIKTATSSTGLSTSDILPFGKSIGADILITSAVRNGNTVGLAVLDVKSGKDARLGNGDLDQFYFDDLTETTLATPEVLGFIDSRDWQIYSINKIGNLVWMSQNLNYEIGDGKCFDDDVKNCKSYFGKLYKWEDAKNVCPNGWHLPSIEEWKDMADSTAFGKPTNFSFIIDYDISGNYSFWTSSETSANEASIYYMTKTAGAFNASASWDARDKSYHYSVRCVYNH